MSKDQTESKIKVLYLDDEDNNLRSFKAAFRRQYEVFTANTSEEAFDIVKNESPQVIFSDQRMPVTTGVEFFNAVRQVFPDPVRILITGFTDVNAIIDAINKGHVYRYITKPWSEAEIKVAIENAYDLYRTRKELQTKITDLEKVNEELNRFIYSASHDLRAPLTSILGVVRVARLEMQNQEDIQYIDKIEQSVKRLDVLIGHIVDYYKNSKTTNQYADVNIEEMLDEVVESIKSDRGVDDALIDSEIKQDKPFKTDDFRLRIILSHLIFNAIKFKKPDQDRARVKVTFEVDDEWAYLLVKDQGIGILQHHVNQVFNMFFKGKSQESGSGLGLYIVREALRKMEGEINVETEPNKGTAFHIKIPNRAHE